MMLKGKTALITGSTSGIGLNIATKLAQNGVNICVNGFGSMEEINKILADIRVIGVKAEYYGADMSKPKEIQSMIHAITREFGSIDILVNNAGIQHVSSIEDFPDDKWDAIIAINLSSSFHTIKHSLAMMKKNNWGRIINIASAHGLVASANKSAYVAAKHGIVGLTKSIALETAEKFITCNAICPGWVKTPLVEKQINDIAAKKNISIDDATVILLSEKQPSLRFVKDSDISDLVIFLCSDAGCSITGTALPIDGGWTAR